MFATPPAHDGHTPDDPAPRTTSSLLMRMLLVSTLALFGLSIGQIICYVTESLLVSLLVTAIPLLLLPLLLLVYLCHQRLTRATRQTATVALQARYTEQLNASEQRYRQLVELSPDLIAIHNATTFRYINIAGARLFGATRAEDVLDTSIYSYLSPSSYDTAQAICKARTEQLHLREQQIIRLDGTTITVEMSGTEINDHGQTATLLVMRDVSGRKRAESERITLERQLLEAQRLESLGVLAGGIAHDFNNLLMIILGNLSLARMDLPADSPAQEAFAPIEAAARRAVELSRQMLAYSGRGQLAVHLIDLNRLIEDLLTLMRASVTYTVALHLDLVPRTLPLIADTTQLTQMLMNLVMNASEAIGDTEGSVTISTRVRSCDRAFLDRTYIGQGLLPGEYVELQVSDTGHGMDRETATRMFEPFFTTRFVGRGLGLAAVLGIVRGHHGTIAVQSVPGSGTAISVYLPLTSIERL